MAFKLDEQLALDNLDLFFRQPIQLIDEFVYCHVGDFDLVFLHFFLG